MDSPYKSGQTEDFNLSPHPTLNANQHRFTGRRPTRASATDDKDISKEDLAGESDLKDLITLLASNRIASKLKKDFSLEIEASDW